MKQRMYLEKRNLNKSVTPQQVSNILNQLGKADKFNVASIFNGKATMKMSDVLDAIGT